LYFVCKKPLLYFLDYLYSHIFGWYQKMVDDGRQVDPSSLTDMLFGTAMNGWVLLFSWLVLKPVPKFNTLVYTMILVTIYGITDMFYSKNNRGLKVYNDIYLKSNKAERKRGVVLSMVFIFVPYLLYILLALIFH